MKKPKILIILTVIALALIVLTILPNEKHANDFKKFNSEQELKDYLKTRQIQNYYDFSGRDIALAAVSEVSQGSFEKSADSGTSYSKTNIQVENVDEPDIVKNDGKYIYILSGENLTIMQGYPAEDAKILSIINLNGNGQEIFINNDKLIIFGQENYNNPIPLIEEKTALIASRFPYYIQKSFIKVYSIKDKENPKMEKDIAYDGSYYDARMIDNYVYVIINQPINYRDDNVILPLVKDNENDLPIKIDDIYYFDIYDNSYQLTTIMSLNIDTLQEPERKMFLTGYTQNIYVSENNIYLTSQKQFPYLDYQKIVLERAMIPLVDLNTQNELKSAINSNNLEKAQSIFETYYNKLPENEKQEFMKKIQEKSQEIEKDIQKETQKTVIHKIEINDNKISYKARGEVPGTVLNQFSMDEYKSNFRVATTTGDFSKNSLNHMYNLDENLNIIGKLEDLAHGEKIYSARFIGKRAYLVTFKKVDPLFVVDFSNDQPRVLGKLKIPGYSDYLHPYDENHIIGIGKEAVESSQGDFALYQGLKLSLFDVSNVENPIEISKYNIGDRGTDSESLYEHKAFLFDKEKGLLVMPISLHEVKERNNQPGFDPNSAYGELTYEGAYVFSLNLEDGFKLKGRITHLNNDEVQKLTEKYYYPDYNSKIRRSLYINNYLYTISGRNLKINNLESLKEIKTIDLPFKQENYMIAY